MPSSAVMTTRSELLDLHDQQVRGTIASRGGEILAADHEAPEQIAEDSSLVFRERVYEDRNAHLCGSACFRDFARFAGAKGCLVNPVSVC